MTPEARFAAALDDLFATGLPARIGLAVSGGGDSTALMHLAAGWAAGRPVTLDVVTVDHGLRPESAAEAQAVAAAAAALGLPHATLRWTDRQAGGNLQDAARRARRALIDAWAQPRGVGAVLTGHTSDDQAETVLMRLARGSGVDGLGGMSPLVPGDPAWARPLLGFGRAELRAWLRSRQIPWAEDPSNDDPAFDRVRARRMLAILAPLGLTVERLDLTARHMRQAREVLDAVAADLAARAVRIAAGDLVIDATAFAAAAPETRTRLLAAALAWVSGASYRPRYAALQPLAEGGAGPLQGCLVTRSRGTIRVSREPAAVAATAGPTDAVWDGRWRLDGPHAPDLQVRALTTAGLALLPKPRRRTLPAASLAASPAVWRGAELVAAPLAGHGPFTAALVPGRDQFTLVAQSR